MNWTIHSRLGTQTLWNWSSILCYSWFLASIVDRTCTQRNETLFPSRYFLTDFQTCTRNYTLRIDCCFLWRWHWYENGSCSLLLPLLILKEESSCNYSTGIWTGTSLSNCPNKRFIHLSSFESTSHWIFLLKHQTQDSPFALNFTSRFRYRSRSLLNRFHCACKGRSKSQNFIKGTLFITHMISI